MFVNFQLVVFMQYARFLLSHKADAISGRSRPWAKLGGGGGGEGGFLPLTLPPFLPSAILSFFFLPKIRGWGEGNWPPGPYLRSITAHITNTIYVREWMLEIWIMLYVYGLFRPFQRTYLLEARSLITTKRKNQFSLLLPPLRTPEECYLIDSYFGSRHWRWYWIYPQAPNCKQLLDEVFVISRII